MELFAEIVNGFQPLTIFEKSSILYIWLVSECPIQGHLNFQGIVN